MLLGEGFVPDIFSAVGHTHMAWSNEDDSRVVTVPVRDDPDTQMPRPTIAGLIVNMGLTFEAFGERHAAIGESDLAQVGELVDLAGQMRDDLD